jgi:hypothetical protein
VSNEDDKNKLTDYLLGRLPEEEEVRLENGYLAVEDAQERLLVVEDELVEAYARGRLSSDERELMERRLLASSEGRRKLEVAEALIRIAGESAAYPEPAPVATRNPAAMKNRISPRTGVFQPVFLRFALAAAALILIAGIWSIHRRQAQQVAVRDSGEMPQARKDGSGREAARSPEAPPLVASVVLSPGLSRGGGSTETLRIVPGVSTVKITVVLESRGRRLYRVELRGPGEDKTGSTAATIPVTGDKIVWQLPASRFENGEYTLWMMDPGDKEKILGESSFTVVKK